MTRNTRSNARLRVDQLDNRDIADVAVCLHLHRDELMASWTLVFDGPAEVVMLADRGPESRRSTPEPPLLTIHLSDEPESRSDRPHTLRRPLDGHRLIELLLDVEQRADALSEV